MKAGNVKSCLPRWQELTSDREVLDTAAGLPVELVEDLDMKDTFIQYPFKKEEYDFIQGEIRRLMNLRAVVRTTHEVGEYISPIFLRPKDDGSYRLILNLKKLNEATEYIHFKMDTLSSILCLITPGAYMAKIDIKDAYYSVPIRVEDQKKLKFQVDDELYQFVALPNGYSPGPRKFTKLLKPPLSFLRMEGVTVAAYLDDLFTLNRIKDKCTENIIKICRLLEELGFVIHPLKTMFEPSTVLEYLGFILDSVSMTVKLPVEKKTIIRDLCQFVLREMVITIRTLARLLGLFSSSFIAVSEGKLHYRGLERDKTRALARNKGRYDRSMSLSQEGISEIHWWLDNIMTAESPIMRRNPQVVITTDACSTGWGACRAGNRTGGLFLEEEMDSHINILEAKAVLFGLKALCSNEVGSHIKILSDNSATVGALNNMGSARSPELDAAIKESWDWALQRDIWLSAAHIPGKLNVEADEESRKTESRLEWKLNEDLFTETVTNLSFTPTVDLFASRINKQLDRFFSYRPDPEAEVIDAFSVDWGDIKFYAFPPFNIINRVLQKVVADEATGIIIVPEWPTQIWYHMLSDLTIDSFILPYRKTTLHLPNSPEVKHPLHNKLTLRASLISGRH